MLGPEYMVDAGLLGYVRVVDVYRRHEEWQVGDHWGERQDWHVGFKLRTMHNGDARSVLYSP